MRRHHGVLCADVYSYSIDTARKKDYIVNMFDAKIKQQKSRKAFPAHGTQLALNTLCAVIFTKYPAGINAQESV